MKKRVHNMAESHVSTGQNRFETTQEAEKGYSQCNMGIHNGKERIQLCSCDSPCDSHQ